MNEIPTSSKSEVKKYLNKWETLDNYVLQEDSLNKLFIKTYPKNDDINDILIKASSLNDFYSTNIFSIFSMSKHLLNFNIDYRLKNGDESLVNDIASIEINGRKRNFYSFATKYCSHHNPNKFLIYDSYVEKMLVYFNKKDRFFNFKKIDLKDYAKFKKVLIEFKKFYNIDEYNLKDIDKYLWLLGKEYFPKKY